MANNNQQTKSFWGRRFGHLHLDFLGFGDKHSQAHVDAFRLAQDNGQRFFSFDFDPSLWSQDDLKLAQAGTHRFQRVGKDVTNMGAW